ncbi:hypothetical protein CAPTEDRAFT_163463 [Capitella teleta]|uniref:Protein kinase domain-containing protein n=1 Tax=Capitella teleta TaxID=283909 RepID=R7VCU6_CAPTE|nr:hypothetical protein CAPTEDRAFT_163463 [Capitella teleta]|eukprot:ELU16387.1 hypothetical protein CAPTEDRAFT_163463 [Capitella teleta]
MKKLQHRRLIQLYQAFESKTEMCLILEIIYGGELFDRVISEDFLLTEKACQCFIRQICEGLEYMHTCSIIHLDMKPENILCISQTGNRIKIIDFGLAREWNPKRDLRVLFGTPEFMAPEVVQYEPITFATDMWSVGVISYVLLSGLSPFMGDTDADTLQNVIDGDYDFDYPEFEAISSDAKDLVSKLLVKQNTNRLSARECLDHSWLQRKPPPLSPSLDLSKKRLKTFVYRRKWQKIVNAIIALKRMGVQLKALRKSSLENIESGMSILSPELLAALNEEEEKKKKKKKAVDEASNKTATAPPPEVEKAPAKKGFFQLGRKKSSKEKSSKPKKGSDGQIPSEPSVNEEEAPKAKTKPKEGGFFNMLKKQRDCTKDTHAKSKAEKPTLAVKPNVISKPPPTTPTSPSSPTPSTKPETAASKLAKQRPLQRDNSLRRSTKVSKQGGKGEQYVKLKSLKKQDKEDEIAASTPNLAAAKSNGLDSNIVRVPSSGFATISRVKDRIKFLEQKGTPPAPDVRWKKTKSAQDSAS